MPIRLDLLSSFRRHLRAAATAPRTIELYSQSVRYFTRWLTDRGRERVLDELTAQALDRYLRVRAQHPHARSPGLLLGQRGPMPPDGTRTS